MATIISFANHKGGVGKTASVSALGSILAARGFKVLLVDLDAQANLTRCHMSDIPSRTVYNTFKERSELPVYEVGDNLYLAPSGLEMAGIELEISGTLERERILSKALRPERLPHPFDYILIDCPPALGLVTINAFVATQFMFVPMLADTMSLYGLEMLTDVCNMVREINPSCKINGVFFTKFDKRVNLSSAILELVVGQYTNSLVLESKIRINTKVGEAPLYHKNILEYDPEGKSIEDYSALLDEILERINQSKF